MAKKAAKAASATKLFEHGAEPPKVYKTLAPTITDMPELDATYDVSSDTTPEMRAHLEAADKEWTAISHLIGDRGRLDKTAYFHLAMLPEGQMEELTYRAAALSDNDWELFLTHVYAATEHVNFAWFPHWFGAIFPNDTSKGQDRKEEFMDRIASPRLMGTEDQHVFPIHAADLLCEHGREIVEKYLPVFLADSMNPIARVQLAYTCYALTDEERLSLVTCAGHTAETLKQVRELVHDPSALAAIDLLNMDVADE